MRLDHLLSREAASLGLRPPARVKEDQRRCQPRSRLTGGEGVCGEKGCVGIEIVGDAGFHSSVVGVGG